MDDGPVRVLSVHSRVVNLAHGEGGIMTLAHPSLGNGPDTLLIEGPWPLPLDAGQQGELRDGRLSLGPLRLALPSRWEPPAPPEALAPRIPVRDTAADLAERGGLVPAVLTALGLGAPERDPFAIAARPGLAHLKLRRWQEAVRSLVGLGTGLTPGGDDVLAGYLTALHRMRHPEAAPLAQAVSALPPGSTTPLSQHLLRWAARGVAGEQPLAWLDSLLTGSPAAPALLRPVLAHGATSGAEWAGGALLAIDHQQNRGECLMRLYDLSIPTGVETPAWPSYEPLQVHYFKRLSFNGANGQIIKSSNHVGTHLDGQRHFVTGGADIASIPLERLYGPGVIVDLSDIAHDYGIYTSRDIEERVDVQPNDILFIHTGYSRYGWDQPEADEQRYMLRHPGPTREFWEWCRTKQIKLLGVDCGSQDHPMNTKIRDWRPDEARKADAALRERYGKGLEELFAPDDYQGMHFGLFPHGILHVECLGGEIRSVLNQRTTLGVFPWKFKDGEAAFCRVVAFHEA